ncbi:hypothetical protein [Saccharothrix obliqua]|uniref:hypothetical protein n=1 Tax=Saccharothrix obliqua TaxID=2861747 RepID=UPI001C5F1FE9|nr:hypothetical protein [Saccharothrix obliqua]MBW4722386.1 hypothetical protein [Saccharothrix obliqua]
MGTRRTTELTTGDRVTTPDGGRTGMVRRVHEGGPMGNQPGRSAVQFQRGSVEVHDPDTVGGTRHWVTEPDDAEWTVR